MFKMLQLEKMGECWSWDLKEWEMQICFLRQKISSMTAVLCLRSTRSAMLS